MMLFDVFSRLYDTKFTVGKWQLSDDLHCREEERSIGGGVNSTLGESPSSSQLRPHGPWRTGEIRGPVLLQTLALYSYMTFENAKVAKIEKYIYIFKLK